MRAIQPNLYELPYRVYWQPTPYAEPHAMGFRKAASAMMWRQAVLSQGGVLLKFEAAGANISEINRRVK